MFCYHLCFYQSRGILYRTCNPWASKTRGWSFICFLKYEVLSLRYWHQNSNFLQSEIQCSSFCWIISTRKTKTDLWGVKMATNFHSHFAICIGCSFFDQILSEDHLPTNGTLARKQSEERCSQKTDHSQIYGNSKLSSLILILKKSSFNFLVMWN